MQKIPTLFAKPPKPGEDTRALPKIWEAKSDFEAKTADFGKVTAENKDKAKTVDELKVARAAHRQDLRQLPRALSQAGAATAAGAAGAALSTPRSRSA